MAMMECTDLRIGTAVATLQYLRNRGLPEPDDWTYAPYSVTRLDGNGQPRGYGNGVATWTWETLDAASVSVLFDFLDSATAASGQCYISTYIDPTNRARTTDDFSCYMWRPVDGDGKAIYPGSLGKVYQNVTLRFTSLEAA